MAGGCSLVLLAGGRSRRMGRDKASLDTRSETLIQRIINRLSPVVDEIVIAGGSGALAQAGVTVVADEYPDAGPLAGMHAGLRHASCSHAWVVACDLPDIEPALGPLLLRESGGVEAVVPRPGGTVQGLCAIYAVSLLPLIERFLTSGERRVSRLIEACRVRYIEDSQLRLADPDLQSFRNLNTPADYEAWLSSLER